MARCPECGADQDGQHINGCDERPVYVREDGWQSDKRETACRDNELVYSAIARCQCGAGLAYAKRSGPDGYWDCSAVLTGRAAPKGQPGSVVHSHQFPFAFYEIKSEQQPSAGGATTRP